MDIQVSSNFERLLFEMNDRDGNATAAQLTRFRESRQLSVDATTFGKWVRPVFRGQRCSDTETLAKIAEVRRTYGVLVDPHTAVGLVATDACAEPSEPVITLATAHPAKFSDAVKKATGVTPELPAHLADLFDRAERTEMLPNDLATVQRFVAAAAASR